MFFVQFFSFLVVLIGLGQCQRFTTTSDAPWVWGGDSSNEENPSIRTTKPPRPVSPTPPTTENLANPTVAPSPRVCPGCPRTPQFNPVCGSDNATYDNPNAVDCANMCGPKIEIMFYAACRPTA